MGFITAPSVPAPRGRVPVPQQSLRGQGDGHLLPPHTFHLAPCTVLLSPDMCLAKGTTAPPHPRQQGCSLSSAVGREKFGRQKAPPVLGYVARDLLRDLIGELSKYKYAVLTCRLILPLA